VHLRIYDPGRGGWKEDTWTLIGYDAWIGQHQVKHGVVAWTAHRKLDDGRLEHRVVTATYDPKFGSWVLDDGSHKWQVPWNSLESPELLRVKNGVVAWPMNKTNVGKCSGECCVFVFMTTYDNEVHQWVSYSSYVANGWNGFGDHDEFDWIEIRNDSAKVRVQYSEWFFRQNKRFDVSYDPSLHTWVGQVESEDSIRRAFFVAQPESGIVPFRAWFWDCSTGLDGTDTPSTWRWSINNGQYWIEDERSPSFNFAIPGPYIVTENIHNAGYFDIYSSWVGVSANTPSPPLGGISIDNDAQYATSANITLSLNYGSSATEMCFREFPGSLWWTSWQPVAAGREWILSTTHIMGGTADGLHTVQVKYRDQYGTESAVYQDTITMVLTPPVGSLSLNNGDATTLDPSVTVAWSAVSNYPMQMSYCAYNAGDTKIHWSSWETYQPATRTFNFNSTPGKKTVMVQFKDVAGNITQAQAGIELIPLVPPSADLSLSLTDSPDPVMTESSLT
jgi:hypothetical protein